MFYKKRSKLEWIERWATAHTTSWMKNHPEWLDLWATLWSKLPSDAIQKILGSGPTFIIVPPVSVSQVFRMDRQSFPKGLHLLQLNDSLLFYPKAERLAILAHELAHLCLPATDSYLENDLKADALVVQWGFGLALKKALKETLSENEPLVAVRLLRLELLV